MPSFALRPAALAVSLTLLVAPRAGLAETSDTLASSPPSSAPAPALAPALGLGPQGFFLGQPESGFQLRLRGVVQADGRAFFDATPPPPGTFLIRRARIYIEGTVANLADFRLMPDFGDGKLSLQDAYVDLHPFPLLRLRAGKFKSPFGLERLQAEQNLTFIERGLTSNLVPDRDVGVSLHGELEGLVNYELAVLNGTVDNGNVDSDVDSAKDVVARLFAAPFHGTRWTGLRALGLGAAVTAGREFGTAASPLLPAYRTNAQTSFFTYRTDPTTASRTTVASGEHVRFSPQAYEYVGPLGVLVEYERASQAVLRGTTRGTVVSHAWQVEASLVLTGEHPSYGGLEPRCPFRRASSCLGAVELVARYGWMRVGEGAFPVFADPRVSARRAEGFTVGANWYFTRTARLAMNFERTLFEGGATAGDRPPENAVLGRLQVAF